MAHSWRNGRDIKPLDLKPGTKSDIINLAPGTLRKMDLLNV